MHGALPPDIDDRLSRSSSKRSSSKQPPDDRPSRSSSKLPPDIEKRLSQGGTSVDEGGTRVDDVEEGQCQPVLQAVNPLSNKVVAAGSALAFNAGIANTVAFHALSALVSHVSGNWSRFGIYVEDGMATEAIKCFFLVAFFVLGSFICGCAVPKDKILFDFSGYGLVLVFDGVLMILVVLVASESTDAAAYLLAMACGLQNGVASSYSGSAIRTTHVTGTFTDIGLILGRSLNLAARKHSNCLPGVFGEPDGDYLGECRKLFLLFALAASFLLGIIVGGALHHAVGIATLVFPAVLQLIFGAVYVARRAFFRNSQSDEILKAATPHKQVEDDKASVLDESDPHHISKRNTTGNGHMDDVDGLLSVLDSMQLSLVKLFPPPMLGAPNQQDEALDAHQRLRSALLELRGSAVAATLPTAPSA